jgi:hypothetical protein
MRGCYTCNAIDKAGRQTHILGVVGHQTGRCHTKKVDVLPVKDSDECCFNHRKAGS